MRDTITIPVIPSDVVGAHEELAHEAGAGLAASLLASVGALMLVATGHERQLIGFEYHGRDDHARQSLIGFLAGTLLVPLVLSRDASFRQTIAVARDALRAQFAENTATPPRWPPVSVSAKGHGPTVCEACLNFVPAPRATPSPTAETGIATEAVSILPAGKRFSPHSPWDLWLVEFQIVGTSRRGCASGYIDYASDVMGPRAARWMARSLTQLLARSAQQPDACLGQFCELTSPRGQTIF